MYLLPTLLSTLLLILPLAAAAPTTSCNHDNCYRAIIAYERQTAPAFCSEYLATSSIAAPSPFATCGASRISSACDCLTTIPPTPTTSTPTTTTTSSCNAFASAPGCPTPASACCQFYCGAALVPFGFCSPTNDVSPYSACCECGTPGCGPIE